LVVRVLFGAGRPFSGLLFLAYSWASPSTPMCQHESCGCSFRRC